MKRRGTVPVTGFRRRGSETQYLVAGKWIAYSVLVALGLSISGCSSFGATGLRCGVDGDASYVEIVSAPQQIANNSRALAELCGFAYEEEGSPE